MTNPATPATVPAARPHPPRRRRWQARSLPDPDAELPAPVRQAQDHLRRRGFAVVPQKDGRFQVEAELLTAAELVARAAAMHAREERLRARRHLGTVLAGPAALPAVPPVPTPRAGEQASLPGARGRPPGGTRDGEEDGARRLGPRRQTAGAAVMPVAAVIAMGHPSRGDAPGVAAPDWSGRSPVPSTASVVVPEEDLARLVRQLLAARTRAGLAAARARGQRLGRRPLDRAKVLAALDLVAAGLSPRTAAQRVGLGRSTVYRELGRARLPSEPDQVPGERP